MIKILHNPRCRKSREGLDFLVNEGVEPEIIKYLENKLNYDELSEIIGKLSMTPLELVRKNEAIWKTEFKGKSLSNKAVIEAMVNYPKLIERPIIINKTKAVVGRPTEAIKTIL